VRWVRSRPPAQTSEVDVPSGSLVAQKMWNRKRSLN
jgi:hypothetical protein